MNVVIVRPLIFVAFLFMSSCMFKADDVLLVGLGSKVGGGTDSGASIVVAPKQYIYAGDETLVYRPTGEAEIVGNAFGFGAINTFFPSFKAPSSTAPMEHSISLTQGNIVTQIPLSIIGVGEGVRVDLPEGYGDQSYPMSLITTDDGTMYVISIVIDSPGWEWAVTWKSTDHGDTWQKLDKYVKYNDPEDGGETHILDMTSINNDVFQCGFAWQSGVNGSHWVVRRTLDAGATWTEVESLRIDQLQDNVCQGITSTPSGSIVTAGFYDQTSGGSHGMVRESLDNGTTWSTIGDFTDMINIETIRTAPDGSLWLFSEDASVVYFRKGVKTAGTWVWGPLISLGFDSTTNLYNQQMDISIIDNNTAVLNTGISPNSWVIYKTVDGGDSWTNTYTRSGYRGENIIKLANGDLLATGSVFNTNISVIKSIDNGNSWTETFNGSNSDGGFLTQASNGRVQLVAYDDVIDQMASYHSEDDGDTWAAKKYIFYTEQLWSEVSDFTKDAAGNLYSVGWTFYYPDDSLVPPSTGTSPFAIMRSTNEGSTWNDISFFVAGDDMQSMKVDADDDGRVFVLGSRDNTTTSTTGVFIRGSMDNGVSWFDVDFFDSSGASSYPLTALDGNGNYYYFSSASNGNFTPLRKVSSNGTVTTSVRSFPLIAGYTPKRGYSFDVLPNGNLLILVNETNNSTSASEYNLYLSSDEGVSWTQIYSSEASIIVRVGPDGRIFVRDGSDEYYVSKDIGQTWEMMSALSGYSKNFVISKDNKLIFSDADKIQVFSELEDRLVDVWQLHDAPDNYSSSNMGVVNCPLGAYNVCVKFSFDEYESGTKNYYYPLTNGEDSLEIVNPSSVSKTGDFENELNISWRSSRPDTQGFKLVYQEGHFPPASCNDSSAVDLGNTNSTTVESLKGATKYTFRICSYNSSGVLSSGEVFTMGTATSSPEVTDLAFIPKKDQVSLTWTSGGGATLGFFISYFEGSVAPLDCLGEDRIDVGSATGHVITDLTPGTKYSFKVCSYSSNGSASFGANISASTLKDGWNLVSYVKAVNGDASDYFAENVAIYNDILAVSASAEDSNQVTITNGATASSDNGLSSSGAIYVYRKANRVWTQEAFIKASNAGNSDGFGQPLAISNDTIVASAINEDSSQNTITNSDTSSTNNSLANSGAVFVYRYTGGIWEQEAYLKADNAGNSDRFGRALAIDGDRIIVGVPEEDGGSTSVTNGLPSPTDNTKTSAGAAYIFKRTGTTWVQEAYLKASDSAAGDYFGASVDISGDTAVVGAAGNESVYIYKLDNSGQWSESAILNAYENTSGDYFGYKVELEGDYLAVGAPRERSDLLGVYNSEPSTNENVTYSGAVYIYHYTGTQWVHDAYIKANKSDTYSHFGSALSMSGRSLSIAYYKDEGLLIYERNAGQWSFKEKVDARVFNITGVSALSNIYGTSSVMSGPLLFSGDRDDQFFTNEITNFAIPTGPEGKTKSGAAIGYENLDQLYEPKGFSFSNITSNQIDLIWETNIGERGTGIKVAYIQGMSAPADCDSGNVVDEGMNSSTSITGLLPNTIYSFRICSYSDSTQLEGYTRRFQTLP